MRKITAICCLLILVFNMQGYQWVIVALEMKSIYGLEKKLETGFYKDTDLVEIKLAFHIPDYTNSPNDYQSYSGNIEIDGNVYQYLQRKVTADTLYLLCIANEEITNLRKVTSAYYVSLNEAGSNGKGQKNNSPDNHKLLGTEYTPDMFTEYSLHALSSEAIFSAFKQSFLSATGPQTPAQPPDCWSFLRFFHQI